MIRVPQVRVVDEEGSQLGVMPTAQALLVHDPHLRDANHLVYSQVSTQA
jgi:translation initiation factor IF-3